MDDLCRVEGEALGEEINLETSGLRGPGTLAGGRGNRGKRCVGTA